MTEIRGTFWVVPIMRIVVYWAVYWGPVILGNYHLWSQKEDMEVSKK